MLQGVPPELVSVSPNSRTYESLTDWRAVGSQNLSFSIRMEKGDYSGYQGMVARMVCQSTDASYSKTIDFPLNVLKDPIVPPPPGKPALVRVASSLLAVRAEWTHENVLLATQAFEVQWSQINDAFGPGTNSTTTSSFSVSLNATRPLTLAVLYVRVRVVGPTPSPWSAVSNAWQIAKQCDMTQQYLNTSGPFADWRCDSCPTGAWCEGVETTWEDVKPLFGWWRNNIWLEDAASNFTQCSYPPACLGARNFAFKGKYAKSEAEDVAIVSRNESCNTAIGYASVCTRRGDERCRLCATCAVGYRRLDGGEMQCAKCPPETANRVLMAVGVIVALLIVSSMVIDHMVSGGTIDVPNMKQVIVINYFQLTYMIAGTNVAWPDAMKVIFDIEGAFSTIGEHLLNPACELTTIPAAEILYSKQIAYMLVLPCLVLCFKVLWRSLAKCQGEHTVTVARTSGLRATRTERCHHCVRRVLAVPNTLSASVRFVGLQKGGRVVLLRSRLAGAVLRGTALDLYCFVHYSANCTSCCGAPCPGSASSNRGARNGKRCTFRFPLSVRDAVQSVRQGRWFWRRLLRPEKH